MQLSYKENYWDDAALKAEFIEFLKRIFDFDLTRWNEMGYWDRNFMPFSYFDGSRMVSNVCIYSLDMMVADKRSRVAQVSSVATLPDYRRRGLGAKLMEKAMEWARSEHDFFFLFADEEAFPLYRKSGFRMVDEFKTQIAVEGSSAAGGAIKLDIEKSDDLKMIERFAAERSPVSNQLGVLNNKLLMFWITYYLSDSVYYIPDLDILVIYRRENETVTISDIVGEKIPSFSDIYPYISDESDRSVEFLFMTDRLQLDDISYIRVEGNGTHLQGNFPLEGTPFIFPQTSQA